MCCGILLGLPTTAQSNTSAERSQQLILLHSTFTYALPGTGDGVQNLVLVRNYYICAGPQGKSILEQTKGFVRAGASHEKQSSDRGRKKIILFLVALGFPPAGLLWSGEFFKPQLARCCKRPVPLRVFHTRVKLDLQWHSDSALLCNRLQWCSPMNNPRGDCTALLNYTLCAYWMQTSSLVHFLIRTKCRCSCWIFFLIISMIWICDIWK